MSGRGELYATNPTTGYKPPEKCYAPVKPPRDAHPGEVRMQPRRLFGAAGDAPATGDVAAGAAGENKA